MVIKGRFLVEAILFFLDLALVSPTVDFPFLLSDSVWINNPIDLNLVSWSVRGHCRLANPEAYLSGQASLSLCLMVSLSTGLGSKRLGELIDQLTRKLRFAALTQTLLSIGPYHRYSIVVAVKANAGLRDIIGHYHIEVFAL